MVIVTWQMYYAFFYKDCQSVLSFTFIVDDTKDGVYNYS